jgi:hypothetical protein
MSYVLANTQNPLGRRGLGRLGWDNVPYPVYGISRAVARLNGEFNPAGADPSSNPGGAVTYRIDPRSGQYQFYRTDIKPRGVFMQNTFQHPAPPVLSALGVRVLPIGKSVSNSTMRGLGCSGCACAGRCKASLMGPRFALGRRRRGLGAADFPGACGPQSDGTIIPCAADPSMATEQGDVAVPGVTPTVVAPPPGTTLETIINVPATNQIAQGIQQISNALNPPRVQTQQPQGSWLSQSSRIGNTVIPNSALAIGGTLMAALFMEGKGRRR